LYSSSFFMLGCVVGFPLSSLGSTRWHQVEMAGSRLVLFCFDSPSLVSIRPRWPLFAIIRHHLPSLPSSHLCWVKWAVAGLCRHWALSCCWVSSCNLVPHVCIGCRGVETHRVGLPFHGSPLISPPPSLCHRFFILVARLSRPHPVGKGRGSCSCILASEGADKLLVSPHPSIEGRGSLAGRLGKREDESTSTVMRLMSV
jgi:hypothetical protein